MPKGVVWRQEDAFFACIGGGDPMRQAGPGRVAGRGARAHHGRIGRVPARGAAHARGRRSGRRCRGCSPAAWSCCCRARSTRVEVWRTVERERRQPHDRRRRRRSCARWSTPGSASGPFDVSSLFSIGCGGAPLTPSLKDQLVAIVPERVVADGFGSSETGAQGTSSGSRPGARRRRASPASRRTPTRPCSTSDPPAGRAGFGRRSAASPSAVASRSATTTTRRRRPRRSSRSTASAGCVTGDMATVDEDGTIHLLGRGSVCINTGGEKVYPEEVEAVLKAHPTVYDVLVIGVDDERWGQRVAAVVQPVDGRAHQPRRADRRSAASPWPATRCRARWCWSTRSSGRPPARPTTAGPSAWPTRSDRRLILGRRRIVA